MRREIADSRVMDGAATITIAVPGLTTDAQLRIGGPIRRGPSMRAQALETFCNNSRRRVWVPGQARDDSGGCGLIAADCWPRTPDLAREPHRVLWGLFPVASVSGGPPRVGIDLAIEQPEDLPDQARFR